MNKRKIINDPVYGFINIHNEFIFDLIQHPYFQRLRNIHQLGLTSFVYPGATHNRFQHSLGAMHLMQNALDVLCDKGIDITSQEKEATLAAILLHDIGHTPFSHALEFFFVEDLSHEDFTKLLITKLNNDTFKHKLDLTLQIFENNYRKSFLHQLVSSQLDVDRLDYLNRDSFYTGVAEGVVGAERIIKMLNVYDNQLVADIKAIYSIEKFIISRRLMYWQVYLHKTVHVLEVILMNILKRAKILFQAKQLNFISPSLRYFFEQTRTYANFINHSDAWEAYTDMDDNDILFCIKMWQQEKDVILSQLSKRLCNRHLFKIEIAEHAFDASYLEAIRLHVERQWKMSKEDVSYFVVSGKMENRAYNRKMESIQILDKNGTLFPLENISDHLNHRTLSENVSKYFVCYPKEIEINKNTLPFSHHDSIS
ncbi:MAG: HD domain-containing protein [Bacteroidales bacterium]|jgi:HD superfamily phosphohydrolase|nr:HD domain-containing protein [Bacteroidales bacterium]